MELTVLNAQQFHHNKNTSVFYYIAMIIEGVGLTLHMGALRWVGLMQQRHGVLRLAMGFSRTAHS